MDQGDFFQKSKYLLVSCFHEKTIGHITTYSKTCVNGHSQKEQKWFSRPFIAECRSKVLQNAYFQPSLSYQLSLTLNAPITTKVVCFSRLLKCLRSFSGKQCGPRSDRSYRSSLFWVRAVCFYT